ncbi:helix-turn-helix domain-containing protein [Pedobacter frigiditerrae]|uniref:Helix-turn-helix domain-containing protein n=1 Tax=Pedobacter frigiditerrae TaxID=2530452 RepID=A0A4R0MYL0_9SPHI|nr:AraC family transcriptional regulator [Pedobacter frigiditerrae]TCC92400.1 helix-turn-helix domain-containing protein [Pedobacter frigiditerrae]
MVKKSLPIFNIEKFNYLGKEDDFYVNSIRTHLNLHKFVLAPHRHDFFFVAIFTKGSGTHNIDFNNYQIGPGSVFAIIPGQSHSWNLSEDADGYILFHTRSFFNLHFPSKNVRDYPFFCSMHNSPLILLKEKSLKKAEQIFSEILDEYVHEYLLKFQRIAVMLDLVYIDFSRLYLPKTSIDKKNQNFLIKIGKLEDLIDANFKRIKSPSQYAEMMFMSERHLNRICKEYLNKTTSDLIMDRLMLEAKRLLVHSAYSVSEIAEELGYLDVSYFSRLFKKKAGKTPLEFIKSFA